MRFARGYMRDHTVSHKTDHGASYRRYGILRRRMRPKIIICDIFGLVSGLNWEKSQWDSECERDIATTLQEACHASS
jgi:hypothetical protein